MKLLDNTLYAEFSDLIACGFSDAYIKKATSTGNKTLPFIKDPTDQRRTIFPFDQLGKRYQDAIAAKYGNPKDFILREPIRRMVTPDVQASEFFMKYRVGEDRFLDAGLVQRYTTAAAWLNMLTKALGDKKTIKSDLGLSGIDEFLSHVMAMIELDNIDLPRSYPRLLEKVRAYQSGGYQSLISKKIGNGNAAKVSDETSEAVLLEMIEHPNQFDDVFICAQYNTWAKANGYKEIDAQTVGVWRRKKGYQVTLYREGNAAFTDKYNRSIAGKRPSAPMFLAEHDDNSLDFYYIDVQDKTSSKTMHRYKAIVVIDSYNDYVLGYAYSQDLTAELVRAAWANAMRHIRDLTGGWYLPHELRTDNWALANLQPFYETIGHFHKTPVGSKERGYIEQFFRTPHWKRCQKIGANNYNGNNITAINRGVNVEVLEQREKERPLIGDEASMQIEEFFLRLRTMKQGNGRSKQEEWLEAWYALPESDKRPITDQMYLYTFGIRHQYRGHEQASITKEGIRVQINGVQYLYDVPKVFFLQGVGKKVDILYDAYDMERVFVTDNAGMRFLAESVIRVPKALKDHYEGSRSHLNALLAEKVDNVTAVTRAKQKRRDVLREQSIDGEALLKAGVPRKELRSAAELAIAVESRNYKKTTNPYEKM